MCDSWKCNHHQPHSNKDLRDPVRDRPSSTNIYAEIDLKMKAKALGKCEVTEESRQQKHWRDQPPC